MFYDRVLPFVLAVKLLFVDVIGYRLSMIISYVGGVLGLLLSMDYLSPPKVSLSEPMIIREHLVQVLYF